MNTTNVEQLHLCVSQAAHFPMERVPHPLTMGIGDKPFHNLEQYSCTSHDRRMTTVHVCSEEGSSCSFHKTIVLPSFLHTKQLYMWLLFQLAAEHGACRIYHGGDTNLGHISITLSGLVSPSLDLVLHVRPFVWDDMASSSDGDVIVDCPFKTGGTIGVLRIQWMLQNRPGDWGFPNSQTHDCQPFTQPTASLSDLPLQWRMFPRINSACIEVFTRSGSHWKRPLWEEKLPGGSCTWLVAPFTIQVSPGTPTLCPGEEESVQEAIDLLNSFLERCTLSPKAWSGAPMFAMHTACVASSLVAAGALSCNMQGCNVADRDFTPTTEHSPTTTLALCGLLFSMTIVSPLVVASARWRLASYCFYSRLQSSVPGKVHPFLIIGASLRKLRRCSTIGYPTSYTRQVRSHLTHLERPCRVNLIPIILRVPGLRLHSFFGTGRLLCAKIHLPFLQRVNTTCPFILAPISTPCITLLLSVRNLFSLPYSIQLLFGHIYPEHMQETDHLLSPAEITTTGLLRGGAPGQNVCSDEIQFAHSGNPYSAVASSSAYAPANVLPSTIHPYRGPVDCHYAPISGALDVQITAYLVGGHCSAGGQRILQASLSPLSSITHPYLVEVTLLDGSIFAHISFQLHPTGCDVISGLHQSMNVGVLKVVSPELEVTAAMTRITSYPILICETARPLSVEGPSHHHMCDDISLALAPPKISRNCCGTKFVTDPKSKSH